MTQSFDSEFSPIDTSRHQDHVITHVLGATVVGWFVAGDAAHLLLDIGFLWTIYLDCEMNLLPQGVAIPELQADELSSADLTELAFDAQLLLSQGRDAEDLKRFTAAPVECLITAVDLFSSEFARRILMKCETSTIEITTSLETGDVEIRAKSW